MSGFDLATWLAAIVLIAGSLAVFGWFLLDVRRVLREERAAADERSGDDVA